MQRYKGQPLGATCRIAVIANDALGNFVVSTPLLRMLRETYPDARLDYYSGSRAQELWRENPRIDQGFALYGSDPSSQAFDAFQRGTYDLVVNMEASPWAKCFAAVIAGVDGFVVGPCLGSDGRGDLAYAEDDRGDLARDTEWISPNLTDRYPFLQSSFIGEIFCRLAYLEGPVPLYELPEADPELAVPDVLIATAASLPEKLWPADKWRSALRLISEAGLTVGLLGAPPKAQQAFWKGNDAEDGLVQDGLVQDLRGKMTLPQVVGALHRCRHVLTLDNGILHLASGTRTPTVGLFRHGIHRLWAPPAPNITVLTPGEGRAVSEIEVSDAVQALIGSPIA